MYHDVVSVPEKWSEISVLLQPINNIAETTVTEGVLLRANLQPLSIQLEAYQALLRRLTTRGKSSVQTFPWERSE